MSRLSLLQKVKRQDPTPLRHGIQIPQLLLACSASVGRIRFCVGVLGCWLVPIHNPLLRGSYQAALSSSSSSSSLPVRIPQLIRQRLQHLLQHLISRSDCKCLPLSMSSFEGCAFRLRVTPGFHTSHQVERKTGTFGSRKKLVSGNFTVSISPPSFVTSEW